MPKRKKDPPQPVGTPLAAQPQPPTRRFELLRVVQLTQLNDPQWLIYKVLEQEAFSMVYGAPGSGKTFFGIDAALCVATGRPWQGRSVQQGPVVYVAAEAGRGTKKRVQAWLQHQGLTEEDVSDAFFLLEPVQLLNGKDVQALLDQIAALPVRPVLLIIDTLSRCFVGGDENTPQDMGLAVAAIDRFIKEIGVAVLLIHHPGRAGGHERGHTSLLGAVNNSMQLRLDKKSGVITLSNEKQKDEEDFTEIKLALKQVALGYMDIEGHPVTSCVLEATDAVGADSDLGVGAGPVKALKALASLPNGISHPTAWYKAIDTQEGKGVSRKTCHNWRQVLLKNELVEEITTAGSVTTYAVTTKGRELLSATANPVP